MACVAARAALWRGRCRGQVSHETLVAEMQQIADWLKKLGMSEYVQRFADNDIDASVLSELTDQDLKDLGVSLGHRRKMLHAIRDLGNALVATTTPTVP